MNLQFNALPIYEAIYLAFPLRKKLPSVVEMFKLFWPIDRLLDDLSSGEVSYAGATPVMIDSDGTYGEIAPLLTGWTSCMERIARRIDTPLDLSLIRRICNRLETGILLSASDVARANYLIDRCRAVYLACPVDIRKAAVVDELIDIAVDEYGLRKAA